MKRMTACVIVLAILFPITSCKIVKHDSQARKGDGELEIFFSDSEFDPKSFVAENWEPKVLPNIEKRAADIGTVFGGLASDRTAASEKYGYRIGQEGTFFNFAVRGSVKILRVDTSSRNGLAYADIAPFDGTVDAIVQIGPVFKGSSIRDMLDFVSLNSFANQVEFARLAAALNAMVFERVIGPEEPASMEGKKFSTTAVFTDDGESALPVLTPVVLILEEM